MHRLNTSFVLAYHGCKSDVAENLLAGGGFKPSNNDYDWLGAGAYFWQSNPARALQFAKEKLQRENGNWKPAVIGAVIEWGLCLDLTTSRGTAQVADAYAALCEITAASDGQLPENSGGDDKLFRKLDCAVINMLHDMRKRNGDPAVDTVTGVFVEGQPIYDGAGFRSKTHIQICVRNLEAIRGVFRVLDSDLRAP